ncbi:MAG: hypothetical protein M1288_04635 [Actinobacteria bacterium]|nr:hypothetical protein [Actinomycetota bacterium]
MSSEWKQFMEDLRRFRPLITVIAAVVISLPSIAGMWQGNISVLGTLVRVAEAMFVASVGVWVIAKILGRYATIQARQQFYKDGGNGNKIPE